jgi:hypothetical protein
LSTLTVGRSRGKVFTNPLREGKTIVNDVMREVNSDNGVVSATVDVTVGDFWQATYLPWAEANLRASTVAGYKKTWDLYLNDPRINSPIGSCASTRPRTVHSC